MAKQETIVRKPPNPLKDKRTVDPDAAYTMDEITAAPPAESKSWDEAEACARIATAKAKEVQHAMENLFKVWSEFEGATLKAFKKMPAPDAMFSDGPLSPLRMQMALRQNMAKLGWTWAAGLPWGPDKVKTFFTFAEEALTWSKRIVHDKSRTEKIAAAQKAAQKAQDDIGKIT